MWGDGRVLNSPIVVLLTLLRRTLSAEDLTGHEPCTQFFYHICTGVFDALLAAGKGRMGIFGESPFGTVC